MMAQNIKKVLSTHSKKITTITIFGILYAFIGMGINIWPNNPENFWPNIFFKSMAQNYPTYLQFGLMKSWKLWIKQHCKGWQSMVQKNIKKSKLMLGALQASFTFLLLFYYTDDNK